MRYSRVLLYAAIKCLLLIDSMPSASQTNMSEGSNSDRNSKSEFEEPRFDGTRFGNPASFTGWTGVPGPIALFKWKFVEKDDSKLPPDEVLDETLPVQKPDFNRKRSSKLALTWLGHATVLVQMGPINFITDPVWSSRAAPIQVAFGPRRYRPPPIELEELPELDFGVISHNHYDHLDAKSVRKLSELFPRMLWFVPLGVKHWMINNGIPAANVHEMNWGDHRKFDFNGTQCEIWCIPAQHWSQRGILDRFKTLWSGWAVLGNERKFYFAGDTGYCEREFDVLGKKLGPFDLAAIPIGCYAPRWFMKPQHINITEAVKIHQKIRSKKSIAIHWGTYHMGSNEAYLEPPQLLKEEVQKAGLKAVDFTSLSHGETWYEDETSSDSSQPESSSHTEN